MTQCRYEVQDKRILGVWTEGCLDAEGRMRLTGLWVDCTCRCSGDYITGKCSWSGVNAPLGSASNVGFQHQLSKVHCTQCVLMNLYCLSKCLMVSAVTLTRSVAAFSAVMFFIHQVISGSKSH